MNSGLADETVGAIDGTIARAGQCAANNEALVVEGLIPHDMWLQQLSITAVCGTPECHSRDREGTAVISIETTSIVDCPISVMNVLAHLNSVARVAMSARTRNS
jgi:hypothetical protein